MRARVKYASSYETHNIDSIVVLKYRYRSGMPSEIIATRYRIPL